MEPRAPRDEKISQLKEKIRKLEEKNSHLENLLQKQNACSQEPYGKFPIKKLHEVCICYTTQGETVAGALQLHYSATNIPYCTIPASTDVTPSVIEQNVVSSVRLILVITKDSLMHPNVALAMNCSLYYMTKFHPVVVRDEESYYFPEPVTNINLDVYLSKKHLQRLLSSYTTVASEGEGYFALLPDDLLKTILSFINEERTFGIISRVSKRWKSIVDIPWQESCARRNLLDDLPFWKEKAAKDWKWLLMCKKRELPEGEQQNDPGKRSYEHEGTVFEYMGEWLNGKRHGWGNLLCNGAVYLGQFENDKKHGWGLIKYPSGDQYEGEWANDKKEGTGKRVFSNGDTFEGTWHNDLKHGRGLYTFGPGRWGGHSYDGEWTDDHKHGRGKYSWPNGDVYEGEWTKNQKEGRGLFRWANGDVYDGEWKGGLKHGWGVYVYGKGQWYGDRYEGEWANDRKEGKGKYRWASGDSYDGMWKDGLKHGDGVYTWSKGDEYSGPWEEDKRCGFGVYRYSHGGRYEGTFREDKRDGKGTFYFADGEYFMGTWKHGARIGPGVLHRKNGQKINQMWDEVPDANYSVQEPAKFPTLSTFL